MVLDSFIMFFLCYLAISFIWWSIYFFKVFSSLRQKAKISPKKILNTIEKKKMKEERKRRRLNSAYTKEAYNDLVKKITRSMESKEEKFVSPFVIRKNITPENLKMLKNVLKENKYKVDIIDKNDEFNYLYLSWEHLNLFKEKSWSLPDLDEF